MAETYARKQSLATVALLSLGSTLLLPSIAGAFEDNEWLINDGFWAESSNWSMERVPTDNDRAFVGNGGTVRLDSDAQDMHSVRIGHPDFGIGEGTMIVESGSIAGGNLRMGAADDGVGHYEQHGGEITINSGGGDFEIGDDGTGTFEMTAGTINTDDNFQVAPGGTAEATQSGGTVHAAGAVIMGGQGGTNGEYTLSGGTMIADNNVFIGNNGNATFHHKGGTLDAFGEETGPNADNYLVADDPSSTGSVVQSGGTAEARRVYIGDNGEGHYTISGGSLATTESLNVGGSVDSDGADVTGNTGSLTVSGADAAIDVGGLFFADGENSTLNFNIGSDGISSIDADGSEFESLIQPAELDMGLMDGVSVNKNETFDLVSAAGGLDGLPSLVSEDTSNWELAINTVDGEDVLQATTLQAISDILAGDMNGDGEVNNLDINPFVLALTDEAAFEQQFGVDPASIGDINGDGEFNNLDINPFVSQLTGGSSLQAVPEPASLALLALGGTVMLRRRRHA